MKWLEKNKKGVIIFGMAKGHPSMEVAEFAGVTMMTQINLFCKQWRNLGLFRTAGETLGSNKP